MEVYIKNEDYCMRVSFIGFENVGGKKKIYDFNTKELSNHEECEIIDDKHFLTMSRDVYLALVKAIQEDISTPKPQREYLDGKLEATEKHLEDMRTIVFKTTK